MSVAICFKHLRLFPLIFAGHGSSTGSANRERHDSSNILPAYKSENILKLILSTRYDNKSKYRVPQISERSGISRWGRVVLSLKQ